MAPRVLVVDDERNNREALAKILGKAGHEWWPRGHGEEAWGAQDFGFDLVRHRSPHDRTGGSRC